MNTISTGTPAHWQLPAGLDEVLPPDGARYEQLRRGLLDLFDCWGYDLVIPPLVEYLDSLLIGAGSDLDRQTFKLTDFESGRSLGVRADMTPQVARIDAHQLRREGPSRLCYIGTVLRTMPAGIVRTRSPVQVGAELYGHPGVESDVEIVSLMLASLSQAGIASLHVDLGHVGIFRHLAACAGATPSQHERLFEALQRKSDSDVRAIASELAPSAYTDSLIQLVRLNGDMGVLDWARACLPADDAQVSRALAQVEQLAAGVSANAPQIEVHIDLAELRGYHYHPGVVFAAFTAGHGQEIARGGRYDGVGAAFGRARAATGFSTDLRTLLMLTQTPNGSRGAVLAPYGSDDKLRAAIARLRARGERVVTALPGVPVYMDELGCDRKLVAGADGAYEVVSVTASD